MCVYEKFMTNRPKIGILFVEGIFISTYRVMHNFIILLSLTLWGGFNYFFRNKNLMDQNHLKFNIKSNLLNKLVFSLQRI